MGYIRTDVIGRTLFETHVVNALIGSIEIKDRLSR